MMLYYLFIAAFATAWAVIAVLAIFGGKKK